MHDKLIILYIFNNVSAKLIDLIIIIIITYSQDIIGKNFARKLVVLCEKLVYLFLLFSNKTGKIKYHHGVNLKQ